MKKLFLAVALFIGIASFTQAQDLSKAIGARLGYGGEISYQQPLSGATRLELDLGLFGGNHGSFLLSGIHQWVFGLADGFNWYAGLGGQVGSAWYSKDDKWGLGLGLAGQLGLEYNFSIPLQMSLDWRPNWLIIPSGYGFFPEQGIALGIRYRF